MAVALRSLAAVLKVSGALTNAQDLSTPSDDFNKAYTILFANGTGANQGNMLFHDQRTLNASANEDLDLAGGLTSAFGTTITFTALKGVIVYAATGNTNSVQVSRPASNGVPLFAAASDRIANLTPGGLFAWIDPSAAGVTVTAGTGDLLNIANSAGGTSVTYDIWLWGEI